MDVMIIPEDLPSLALITDLCRQARELVQDEQRRQAMLRQDSWSKWTNHQLKTGRRELYNFIREDRPKGLTVLQKEDGTLTGNVQEMDRLLCDTWLQTFRLYESCPGPSWASFRDRFGEYIPRGGIQEREPLTD